MKVIQVIKLAQLTKYFIMKTIAVLLLNIFFAASGFICAKSTDGNNNSPLPDTRPADISFRYHVDGGMMYYSEELFISTDSCYYKINDGGAESKAYFKLTAQQLDKLYKVFTDNDFDEIETYTEKVYDRGGEGISLSWGKGKYCSVNSSGMTFIKDSWRSEWAACDNAITKIIAEEIPKQKKDYEIRLDKAFFNNEIYLQVNRDVVVPKSMLISENGMDKFFTKTIKLSPGKHRMSLNIGKKYEHMNINADSSKGIFLYIKNDSLRHEYIK